MGHNRAATVRPQLQYSQCDRRWHGTCLSRVREEKRSMKTKLLALLFLVGSAAFAAPRVAIGVGVGGVGVGVGVGPAYGYYAPPPAYVAPAPYWGARAYYGPRWVAPRYYGPRYYGRGYYGRGWRRSLPRSAPFEGILK